MLNDGWRGNKDSQIAEVHTENTLSLPWFFNTVFGEAQNVQGTTERAHTED